MGDYGLKVSKDGFPVLTADDKDLAFTSKLTSLQVYATGGANYTSTGVKTFSHGLGYVPAFLFFVKNNGGSFDGYHMPAPCEYPTTIAKFVWATSSNINIDLNTVSFSGNSSIDVRYVIFLNQLA